MFLPLEVIPCHYSVDVFEAFEHVESRVLFFVQLPVVRPVTVRGHKHTIVVVLVKGLVVLRLVQRTDR